MKISVGKIVVAVLLVLLIVTGVFSIKQRKSDNAEILKKVTVVSDGKINPANEGKLVLVCGEVDFYEIYLSELEEEQIDSFKIKRTVKDFVSYEKDGQTHYEWQERTEKNITPTSLLIILSQKILRKKPGLASLYLMIMV